MRTNNENTIVDAKELEILDYYYDNSEELVGEIYSKKNNKNFIYSSTLELDFLAIAEFAPEFISYNTSEIILKYNNLGKLVSYSPMYSFQYKSNNESSQYSVVCDIFSKEYLYSNWNKLKQGLKLCNEYCKSNGMIYKIFTEKHIRNDYLDNIWFLWKYNNPKIKYESADILLLMTKLEELKRSTPNELLSLVTSNEYKKAELLGLIWQLLSEYFFRCDLSKKLTMDSIIWRS